MNTQIEFVNRHAIKKVIDVCKAQLNPSPNRTALVYEHLGIQRVYFVSTSTDVRVDVVDRKAFMLARIRYGF